MVTARTNPGKWVYITQPFKTIFLRDKGINSKENSIAFTSFQIK